MRPKIAIVGDHWREQDERTGMPFFGTDGSQLSALLRDAGISRNQCYITNAFNIRPMHNNVEFLCGKKADVGGDYNLSPLKQGKYILPDHLHHIARLHEALRCVQPNLVIALGSPATWALLNVGGIAAIRGTVTEAVHVPGLKVLPTYHPTTVLADWSKRVIVLADLIKAARESEFPEIRRPKRQVLIWPTYDEIQEWFTRPVERYGVDIETKSGAITTIGFARNPQDAIVVPLWDSRVSDGNYWPSFEAEWQIWTIVKNVLENPNTVKLFQNGMYDLQYLMHMGIRPRNCSADTMLLHHALYPEMPKSLGFMGSTHTDESSWKLLNRPNKGKEAKKDE